MRDFIELPLAAQIFFGVLFACFYLLIGAGVMALSKKNDYPALTALFWPLYVVRHIGKEAVGLVNSAIRAWAKLPFKKGKRIELRVEEQNELAELRARCDGLVYRLAKLEAWAQSQGGFREQAFVGGTEPERKDGKIRTPMKA